MKSLKGSIVLITGAAGGLGREMTRQLLRAGSRLILADLDEGVLRQAAGAAVEGAGRRGRAGAILGTIAADLGDAAGAEALYQRSLALAPAVDLLIHNAGVAFYGPFQAVPQERWERLMQVNLLAPMRLTAHFLPAMIERRRGHIVHVDSVAGLVGAPGLAAYSAAKFGLRGFGEALYAELRPYGIDVTNIYPYFTRTPMLQSEQFGGQPARALPDAMLYEPEFVIAELIKGIRRRRLHVYPGAIPRRLDRLRRLAPWALPLLLRRGG